MTSSDTIILLIVDYHAAIGGKTPRAPLAYVPGVLLAGLWLKVRHCLTVSYQRVGDWNSRNEIAHFVKQSRWILDYNSRPIPMNLILLSYAYQLLNVFSFKHWFCTSNFYVHSDFIVCLHACTLSFSLLSQLKRCVDKLSKSTYPSLAPITVFVISGLQSVIY